jgi:hypothetical protein
VVPQKFNEEKRKRMRRDMKKNAAKEPKVKIKESETTVNFDSISTRADLNLFLLNLREKFQEGSAAPVFIISALNSVLNTSQIYALLDNENKEIARDIWLRVKQAGVQLKNPPILFAADEADGLGGK